MKRLLIALAVGLGACGESEGADVSACEVDQFALMDACGEYWRDFARSCVGSICDNGLMIAADLCVMEFGDLHPDAEPAARMCTIMEVLPDGSGVAESCEENAAVCMMAD